MLVSVIVPVYNGSDFLRKSLPAIMGSDHADLEVIVVDDGSTDDSAEICRRIGSTVIQSEYRQSGPAAARNLGAKQAKGDLLVFIDADVVIQNDTISKVVNVFKERPEISAMFGSYDDKPGEKNFLSQYKNLQHHFVHQTSNPDASTFWAGLGAVRREVFISIGGFDCRKFSVPSIEDIELGMRLRAAGHRIFLDAGVQAQHLKKWEIVSLVRTDIFCRALPWSKLILTDSGMINDMNLKTADRVSSGIVGLSIVVAPLAFWSPIFLALLVVMLSGIVFLNRTLFAFFVKRRGVLFAILVFPWLFLYFLYSGVTFVLCWFWYNLIEPRKAYEG